MQENAPGNRKAAVGIACFLALFVPLVALLFTGRMPPSESLPFEAALEYWFLPAFLLLIALVFGSLLLRANTWISLRKRAGQLTLGALFGLLFTVAVFASVKPAFWIQWDETTLMSTSVEMHLARRNALVEQAGLGHIQPIFAQDHRPPLFPFFVSLAHDIFGLQFANAFLVNEALLFLLLFLVFLVVHERIGLLPAIASLALLLSTPVLLWAAASGGYDLLSLFLLLAMLAAALRFLERPGARNFLLFLCLGILHSYNRREALLSFALVGAVTAWRTRRAILSSPRYLALLASLPVLLSPLALLARSSYHDYFEQVRGAYGVSEPFRLEYLARNALAFVRAFTDTGPQAAFPGLLYLLGLGGCLFYLERNPGRKTLYAALFTAGIFAPFVLLLGLVFGDAYRLESLRLFLPVAASLSLSPLLWLKVFPGRRAEILLLAGSLLFFAWRLPSAETARAERMSYESKAAPLLIELVARNVPEPGNALFAFEVPRLLSAKGMLAVHPHFLPQYLAELRGQKSGMRVFLLDIYPPGVDSLVKQAAKGHKTRKVAELSAEGAAASLLEWAE